MVVKIEQIKKGSKVMTFMGLEFTITKILKNYNYRANRENFGDVILSFDSIIEVY
jgi:hypothetical protein